MKTKIILNYLVGFIISILISIISISLILKYTVFDKNYIINILDKENYYEKVYQEIYDEMENDIMPSGFTNEIIDNVFTKNEVKEDIIFFINNMYNGQITNLDKSKLNEKINENITNFLANHNLKITDTKSMQNFTNDLVNNYKNEICLYSYINGLISTFYKLTNIINYIIFILIILLFIIIILSNKMFNFSYLSSSIIASGLIILFIRLFIYEKIDADLLLVITENFSDILTIIIKTIGNYLYYIGIIIIIIGILLSCKVFIKKCQTKEKNKYNIEKKKIDVYN